MDEGPGPELSSLTTALDELTRRVAALAERHAGGPLDALAQGLYEVERSMGEAGRRLARLTKGLAGGGRARGAP